MYPSPAKCLSAPLHHELHYNTPVQGSTTAAHKDFTRSSRMIRKCTAVMMNSTVQDHQHGAKSRAVMACELSTINNSMMLLNQATDTPAKVFARLKAKVQRQNSEDHREVNVVPRQLGSGISTNMQQPPADDTASEGQDTYVLTLSPPISKSTSKNSELEDSLMTSHLDVDGDHNPDLIHKPVTAHEKMITETFTHVKAQQKKAGFNSTSMSTDVTQEAYVLLERMPAGLPPPPGPAKQVMNRVKNKIAGYHGVFGEISVEDSAVDDDGNGVDTLQSLGIAAQSQPESQRTESKRHRECLDAPLQTRPNLMEDSLLQMSPRISIPRKQMAVVMSKQQVKDLDSLDGRMNVNGIHLRDWILKLYNKELIVDGLRIDNQTPWHSSCITERVSSNIIKTASGGTYVLVGKMSHHHNSSFPAWFLRKFLFGFPEMWKEYLNNFLANNEKSGKHQQRNNSTSCDQQKKRPSKNQISKQLKSKNLSTPVSSSGSVQPQSGSVSRSGRVIKPPLEYWRGGRITVGPDMNVTVHEDYSSTSILLTPKTRPVVLLKPLQLPKERPINKSPEKQNSSDEDTLAPRRSVKQRKRTEGTKVSQKKSQDAVFPSDSGSENDPAKQLTSQQAQSNQMYLRRGRSYSRERNSTGSESEVSKLGVYYASAEDSVSAIQAPEGKIKAWLKQKHPQRLIQSEKHSTSCSDSDTRFTQSQVQESEDTDHLFTPPDPLKRSRRKTIKQNTKLLPSIAAVSETNDSIQEGKVTNKKNPQRRKKVVHKYDNYIMTDTDDASPLPEPIRENKSKKSTLKRTRKRESLRTVNRHVLLGDTHPEQSEKIDDPQPPVPDNAIKKQKPKVSNKTRRRNVKEQPAKHPEIEQDGVEGAWTDKELQKLNEAVNSLPKHTSGYWVNVSLVVGTRSAEECQQQYTALYQTHGRSKGKHKTKASKTDEPAKETALITAKVGTLKRKKQMWDFLDHIPKEDHDDIFAGSPMHNKQIKLPVWSTTGDEPDFGQLQNPQTPSSSMFTSVKTPQCLHITPGMLRSVNRDDNDKYIYHLQKVKRQGNHGSKGSPKQDKCTPSVRKTKKRCVAEDDNFVVWNMLSDKDGPPLRGDEEDEDEDDYFMEEY